MKQKLVYLALGDSITFGQNAARIGETDYVSLLAAFIQAKYPEKRVICINAGVPGATARDVAEMAPALIRKWRPDLATCLIGTNDIIGFGSAAIDAFAFAGHLRKIVMACKSPDRQVVVATLPWMAGNRPKGDNLNNQDSRRGSFCEVIRLVVKEFQALPADISDAFGKDSTLLDKDGEHPNQAGHDVIYHTFRKVIEGIAFS